MLQQSWHAAIFLSLFLALVLASHCLYRFAGWPSETSRKFLHVSGGVLALFSPLFFNSSGWVLILCCLALLFLAFTYLRQWLPAVHKTNRKSIGSIIFPIPVYLCFVAAESYGNDLLFYIPILFLTVSDTLAEWIGKKWGSKKNMLSGLHKSVAGSSAFLISATAICMTCLVYAGQDWQRALLLSMGSAALATATEIFSARGLDNLTVPLVTLLFLWMTI